MFEVKNFLWELYPFFYDKMSNFPPYTQMLKKVAENLEVKKGGKYLDAGCGSGNMILELFLTNRDIKVYGFDASSSAIKLASKKLKEYIVSGSLNLYKYLFKDRLPFKNEFFDGICAINFIQYLEPHSFHSFLLEARRTLKNGGNLCLVYTTNPTYKGGSEEFKKFLRNNPKDAISSLPFYLMIGVLNVPMILKANLICYEKEYIENLLREMGFNSKSERIYLETSMLTVGKKLTF
jgi:ubiquinone/menaquinone biosynthesis C-methylase UbiE